jgi:hypothetical protein
MLSEYKNIFFGFLKDKLFMTAISLTVVLSYAYYVFNFSPNVEDLFFDIYYGQNNLLVSVGRFGTVFLDKLLGIYSVRPMIMPIMGIIALFFATILWCCLFKRVSHGKLNRYSYIIFACFLIAAPLIHETLIYTNQAFSVPFSYLCAAFSTILIEENECSKWNIPLAILAMLFAVSIYESLVLVYFAGLMACFILKRIFGGWSKESYKEDRKRLVLKTWRKVWLFLIVFGCALFARFCITRFLLDKIWPVLPGYEHYTSSYIEWGNGNPFWDVWNTLWKNIWLDLFIAGTYYFQITLFDITLLIGVFLLIYYSIKKKSVTLIMCFLMMILSNFVLQVFLGRSMNYRALQIFGFYGAFVLMMMAQVIVSNRFKVVRISGIVIMILLLFYQVNDLNKWFYVNHVRYEEDVENFTKIATDLNENYPD